MFCFAVKSLVALCTVHTRSNHKSRLHELHTHWYIASSEQKKCVAKNFTCFTFTPNSQHTQSHTIACHLFGNSMQSWLGNRFLNFNLCNESKIYQTVIIEKRRVILCKKIICTRTTSPFIKKSIFLLVVYIAHIFFAVCVGFNLFWSNFSSVTKNMVSHKLESLCLNMMQRAQQQHNS